MKVLQLHQPWASLIAVEAKRVETRDWAAWPSLLGVRVAIHACKTPAELWRADELEPFRRRLAEAREAGTLALVDGELPCGFILATAVIGRCAPITEAGAAELLERDPDEHAFGGYSLDEGPRFAWVMRDVQRLPASVPFSGRQGVPDIDPTLLGLSAEQAPQGLLL